MGRHKKIPPSFHSLDQLVLRESTLETMGRRFPMFMHWRDTTTLPVYLLRTTPKRPIGSDWSMWALEIDLPVKPVFCITALGAFSAVRTKVTSQPNRDLRVQLHQVASEHPQLAIETLHQTKSPLIQ
ncbi:MAG: hypothetical protein J3Q66DRAFT_367368 [Benniella sp.]|nr:MAG: hypothetical protein J3Q66DRAFT_367368 [Benniella sp.]